MSTLADLPLPEGFRDHYRNRGIESLYPPQAAAIDAGLLSGESVVASVPTASGKTLLAELAMVTNPGTALYIVPLRALAREKGETFRALPGVEVAVVTGDLAADAPAVAEADIIVATSEKVDSLIRSGVEWLGDLGCVVVDEIHLIDQAERGPTLEMVIAKLRRRAADLQLVALSATIANPEALARWLDAELVVSDWRPVELRRGVYDEGIVRYQNGDPHTVTGASDMSPVLALVRETLEDRGQALVFVHSRRAAETLAAEVAEATWSPTAEVTDAVRSSARTGTGRALADALDGGAAFHHAGLRSLHRSIVEEAFRDRSLGVVCATPTLAAGVNLPARRVVVRDTRRYTDNGWVDLPVLEVHQMFGRAGRPGLDPFGEAILIADEYVSAATLQDRYVRGDPEAITSSLATQDALRTHVLATVASGFADTRRDLVEVLDETFYAEEEDSTVLVDVADLVLDDLIGLDMVVREAAGLRATTLGQTVSRQYIDPRTGAAFVDVLGTLEEWAAVEPLTVLEVICESGEVPTPTHRGGDQGETHRWVVEHESDLLVDIENFDGEYAQWLETIGAVRVLADQLAGTDEERITETYGIGPGDLRAMVERATWLAGALAAIAEVEESSHRAAVQSVAEDLAESGPDE